MDDTDLLKMAGVSTSGLAIILIVYRVLKSVQGKKLVSSCCGTRMEMGVSVEEMTPKKIVIENPLPLKRSETLGVPSMLQG
jgi:hypothetical protein